MSAFVWTKKKREAAYMFADGYLTNEVARAVKVDPRSVRRWKADSTFSEEVDRLTLSVGIASSAERLRIIKRVIREKEVLGTYQTKKDLLDWMKLAHNETTNQGTTLTLNVLGFDAALLKIYGDQTQDDSDKTE